MPGLSEHLVTVVPVSSALETVEAESLLCVAESLGKDVVSRLSVHLVTVAPVSSPLDKAEAEIYFV